MVLYNLMMETVVGQLIVIIGCALGFFAAITTDWKDMWKLNFLSYDNCNIQAMNRILFTLGAILCLFVDFPSRADWVGRDINFLLFPIIGFCSMCIAWALVYIFWQCALWIICWWFRKE